MKHVSAVMCVIGPAPLVDQRLAALADQWLSPAARAVDYHALHYGECAVRDALDAARCAPMMGERRVVVVRGIEQLTPADAQLLEQYAKQPAASGQVLLLGSEATPQALLARLSAQGCAVERLQLESAQERRQWVRDRLAAHGQTLAPDAASAIEQLFGDDQATAELQQQLEQLSLYAGDRRTIDRAMVDDLLHAATPGTVFELADAVGNGEVGAALRLAAASAENARRLPELVGLLAWHLRRVWMGRLRVDAGMPLSAAARELKIPQRAWERWSAQVRRWEQPALRAASRLLLETDLRLKRGAAHPHAWLDALIVTLATLPDGGTAVISSARPYSGAGSLSPAPDQCVA